MKLKTGELVLVFNCQYRPGGDIGFIEDRDGHDHSSFLIRSALDKEITFWADKRFILKDPFRKRTLLEKLKEVFN